MSGNYRALTRTYRPITFDDIVSQEHVSNTLKNAIEKDRIAHAYMFCGPRGVGKTTMARVLARTINQVEDEVDGEALGNTLNIIEIDAASNNKVEDVHRIRETVRVPPQNGRFKIYIIDEVHMLSKAAFNALLKTLEEPPPHVIFIFATTEPHKVLPTILSRVQRFDFRRIKVEEIVDRLRTIALKEEIEIDNESLHVIAKKADGALRDALGLMDQAIAFCGLSIDHHSLLQALNVVGTDRFFEVTDCMIQVDSNRVLRLVEELMQEGHDIQEFLVGLTEHFRNLYMAKIDEQQSLIEASEETKKRYTKVAQEFSEDDVLRAMHQVSEAQYRVKDAHQPRITFEVSLLKLIRMQRVETLEQLMEKLAHLEKMLLSGNIPSSSSTNFEKAADSTLKPEPSRSPESVSAASASPPGNDRVQSELESYRARLRGSTSGTTSSLSERNQTKGSTESTSQSNSPVASSTEVVSKVGRIEGGLALAASPELESKVEAQDTSDESPVHLQLVHSKWEEFVARTKDEISKTFQLCIQRARPIEVRNNQIVIEVGDTFTAQIISEHRTEIARLLSSLLNSRVTIDQKVHEIAPDPESIDPVVRFQKLQQKDPILQSIVEILGAEIEF